MQIILKLITMSMILLTVCSCSGPSVDMDANEYYLQGKAKLDIHNYPEAMTSFLHAEKLAQSTGNDSILALSLQGLLRLSDSIFDFNEKARYAVELCGIYLRQKDYDKMYETLSEFTGYHTITKHPYKLVDELIYFASMLNEKDTVQVYTYDNRLRRRGEILYEQLNKSLSPDMFITEIIEGIKEINTQQIIEKIKHNEAWREEVTDDSANISADHAHLIVTTLWGQGLDKEANDFINFYHQKYTDKIINWEFADTPYKHLRQYLSFRYNNRTKEEFRSTFQSDVREATTRFNYEEVLMREQTIRSQRIIMACIIALFIAIITAACIYTQMLRQRKRLLEEQNMMSASELRSAFHDLEEQHLDTLDHLCNTYYENYSDRSAKTAAARRAMKAITEMAKSDSFVKRIEQHLNDTRNSLLTLLREELPKLKPQDIQLFLYNAAGLSIPSICLLLGESREVIYNRRVRLRARIREVAPPHMEIFLNYLR